MKILHITYTLRGGAGHSLLRHHTALRDMGIDSQIIVGDGKTNDSPVIHDIKKICPSLTSYQKRLNSFGTFIEPFFGESIFSAQSSYLLPDLKMVREADIIEFRMLHSGHGKSFFNLRTLTKISQLKPTVWRLSDMWAFTGYCAYAFDCQKWQTGCSMCPQLREPDWIRSELPQIKFDPSKRIWKLKKIIYNNSSLHIVCPSKWMQNQVRKSILKDSVSITYIPVGVDTNIFSPHDKDKVRKHLRLPEQKFILISSIPSPKNYRKALSLLFEMLEFVQNKKQIALVLIGSQNVSLPSALEEFDIFQMGYIKDEIDLSKLYSSADLFCFPSRCDNSAQVLLEAAACGIPSICFSTCGNAEYVIENITGILIEPYNLESMAQHIDLVLTEPGKCIQLGKNARDYITGQLSTANQAERFINLYKKLIKR